MRKCLFYVIAVLLFAGCSAPKYTYYFDYYDYNAGKRKAAEATRVAEGPAASESRPQQVEIDIEPLKLDDETLVASAGEDLVVMSEPKKQAAEEPVKSYKEMSKSERKEFRKGAKQLMKTYIKAKRSGDDVKAAEAAQAMDYHLKLAAIFGAVGLVALLIGGDFFWVIGGISLIIGVVFFVIWLSRQ